MIYSIIEKIKNIPCWSVEQGYGSFLTFEFGQPHLEVREPLLENAKKHLRYRAVKVHGEWHLWIYCCSWEIYLNSRLIAHSESPRRKIRNALKYINGQKIIKVEIDCETADTVFYFDLGGVLRTEHYNDDIYEQWMLYEPQGNVLSVRNDGMYCYQPGNTPVEQKVWGKIIL
jgi:hypothetical protein